MVKFCLEESQDLPWIAASEKLSPIVISVLLAKFCVFCSHPSREKEPLRVKNSRSEYISIAPVGYSEIKIEAAQCKPCSRSGTFAAPRIEKIYPDATKHCMSQIQPVKRIAQRYRAGLSALQRRLAAKKTRSRQVANCQRSSGMEEDNGPRSSGEADKEVGFYGVCQDCLAFWLDAVCFDGTCHLPNRVKRPLWWICEESVHVTSWLRTWGKSHNEAWGR